MTKYVSAQSDIEGVFATPAWTANSVSTYPVNFKVPASVSEFVKVEFLPLNTNSDYSRFGISGLAIVQIYVSANIGTRRLMEIADLLDSILQNKTLENGTQTQSSSLQILGQDKDNPNLFRGDYQVNFTFYN